MSFIELRGNLRMVFGTIVTIWMVMVRLVYCFLMEIPFLCVGVKLLSIIQYLAQIDLLFLTNLFTIMVAKVM